MENNNIQSPQASILPPALLFTALALTGALSCGFSYGLAHLLSFAQVFTHIFAAVFTISVTFFTGGTLVYSLSWLRKYGYWLLPLSATVLALVSSSEVIEGITINRAGDNLYHLMSEYSLLQGVRAGDNILGPSSIEMGQPILRCYQALYYLFNVGVAAYTNIDLRFIHNLTIVVCFGLSPFAYTYFLRKLGLGKLASGFGAFASMISVAAFGNSFEAYHQAGIVTQSMGGLFFPWFMGNFLGMLRGENRISSTAALFALAFLSHAVMAVFATFAGGLYFLCTYTSIKKTWKKIAGFGVLGMLLVSFWVLPFMEGTEIGRPVPDSIVRRGVMWFTSVSSEQLAMVLTTGRLLDDPRVLHKDQVDPRDKIMDKINIMGTLITRPPVITIFVGIGTLIALLHFRRATHRFLLAGFAFSLMLFAGPDDYPWLRFLPAMKHIQTFRCVYLVEFFAFGLVGIAIEKILLTIRKPGQKGSRGRKIAFYGAAVIAAGVILGYGGYQNVVIGQVHLDTRNMTHYNKMVDAMNGMPNKAYPFRVNPQYEGKTKRKQAWFGVDGFAPYCTHWKAVGPTVAFHMCKTLGNPAANRDFYAMAGIRYYTAQGSKKVNWFMKKKDANGDILYERRPTGKDRKNKKINHSYFNIDSGHESFARPLVSQPVPVVCSYKQWVWMSRSWANRYRSWLREPTTPMPMKIKAGKLDQSDLLEHSKAIFYFDHDNVDDDKEALTQFVSRGGVVISPTDIDGIQVVKPDSSKPFWEALPDETFKRPKSAVRENGHRQETDPGFALAKIKMLDLKKRTRQNFFFDVDLLEPLILTIPMQAFPGWTAELDGEQVPVYPTGPDFVGLRVPSGAHRLAFKWRMSPMHQAAMAMTMGAIVFVLSIWIMGIVGFVRRRFTSF